MFCLIWRIKWYGWKNQKFYIDQLTEEYIYFIKFTSLDIINIFKVIPFEKKWYIFYS